MQRKGIEHAIELVHELGDPRYKLVISHEAGDEGFEYAEWLKEHAAERGVDLRLIGTRIPGTPNGYSIWNSTPTRISSPTPVSTRASATPFWKPSISRSPC